MEDIATPIVPATAKAEYDALIEKTIYSRIFPAGTTFSLVYQARFDNKAEIISTGAVEPKVAKSEVDRLRARFNSKSRGMQGRHINNRSSHVRTGVCAAVHNGTACGGKLVPDSHGYPFGGIKGYYCQECGLMSDDNIAFESELDTVIEDNDESEVGDSLSYDMNLGNTYSGPMKVMQLRIEAYDSGKEVVINGEHFQRSIPSKVSKFRLENATAPRKQPWKSVKKERARSKAGNVMTAVVNGAKTVGQVVKATGYNSRSVRMVLRELEEARKVKVKQVGREYRITLR